MRLSDLCVDAAKINEGGWVRNIPKLEGLSLKVRGVDSAADREVTAKAIERLPRNETARGVNAAAAEKIVTRRLVDALLLDWSGLEGDDGEPVQFSRETAETLLTNDNYRPLRDAVWFAANVVGTSKDPTLD